MMPEIRPQSKIGIFRFAGLPSMRAFLFRGVALALPEPPAPLLPPGCTLAPLREFQISQPGFSRWPLLIDAERIGLTYRIERFTGTGCGKSAP